jgi:hypothetical protein
MSFTARASLLDGFGSDVALRRDGSQPIDGRAARDLPTDVPHAIGDDEERVLARTAS